MTRSTVYRRVTSLEKRGLIRRITSTVVDYEKFGIAALCSATTVTQLNQEKAMTLLRAQDDVKLLWRTCGDYNLLFVVFCEKSEVGETMNAVK